MGYALPKWLLDALGEPREPYLIWNDSKRFIVTSPLEKEADVFFDELETAYDSLASESAIALDVSCLEDALLPGKVYVGNNRILVGKSDQDVLEKLEDELFKFIDETLPAYLEHQEDFFYAFAYLNNHPAFWVRQAHSVPIMQQNWQTTDYITTRAGVWPLKEPNGSNSMVIEFGYHAPEDYLGYYGDSRFQVKALTYELALVEAAKIVQELVYPLGDDKEELDPVEYNVLFGKLKTLREKNLHLREIKENPLS